MEIAALLLLCELERITPALLVVELQPLPRRKPNKRKEVFEMLIDIQGKETKRHICDGLTVKRADQIQAMKIFIHDVKAYAVVPSDNYDAMHHLKYCPYCGVNIDGDR